MNRIVERPLFENEKDTVSYPRDGQMLPYTTRSHTVPGTVSYHLIAYLNIEYRIIPLVMDRRYSKLPGPIPYHTPSHIDIHIEYHIIPTRRTDATVHYTVPYGIIPCRILNNIVSYPL